MLPIILKIMLDLMLMEFQTVNNILLIKYIVSYLNMQHLYKEQTIFDCGFKF